MVVVSCHQINQTDTNFETTMAKSWGGWAAMLGSNYESIALYRISLGIMLLIELVSRFQYLHPFYSDEG